MRNTGAAPQNRDAIRLVEVFSSIQGEGLHVGRRQVFIRTFGCNLRCSYCDSPETLKESGTPAACRVEFPAGSGQFRSAANPVGADDLTGFVRSYLVEPHHSISLTGGEPLLHSRFLRRWLPDVRALGLRIFLETNGLLPDHLASIVDLLDTISMDFKAPSATGIDIETTRQRHAAFLEIARRKEVYAKLVVTAGTTDAELDMATEALAAADRSIPLILQPVTPFGSERSSVSPARLLTLHARASRRLADVRVIPQTHKLISLL
jgi:organic radical activating enzyme